LNLGKLFIESSILCVAFLVLFTIINETMQLDLLSHLFGGISVTIVLVWLAKKYKRLNTKSILAILFACVCIFEVLEFGVLMYVFPDIYPFYNIEYVFGNTNIIDTIQDIIMGMLGGYLFLKYRIYHLLCKISTFTVIC